LALAVYIQFAVLPYTNVPLIWLLLVADVYVLYHYQAIADVMQCMSCWAVFDRNIPSRSQGGWCR